MKYSLDEIKAPVEAHIEEFEKTFRGAVKSRVALLDIIMRYIIKRKGKQIRPMLVFLSAAACGGVQDASYRAASLIELLHTATLVHDDVVDDSNERRGFFSINALWKNKVAVLVGDYLLSKGLLLALEFNDYNLLKIVSEATREMSEGELLQIEKARRLDIKEDVYFEIIRKKTASLLASCCAAGAASSGSDEETVNYLKLFGEKVGIAFQIKDDLFDYQKTTITGKPSGIDIKEQKMTLPLIYLLNNSSPSEKNKIINTVKRYHDDTKRVNALIKQVNESGGIEYAKQKMLEYSNQAIKMLDKLPDSPAKTSLAQLVIYTTERNK